jgi:hypothetical protein
MKGPSKDCSAASDRLWRVALVGVHVGGPYVSFEVGRVAEGPGADRTEEGQPQVKPLHVLQHVVPDTRPLLHKNQA